MRKEKLKRADLVSQLQPHLLHSWQERSLVLVRLVPGVASPADCPDGSCRRQATGCGLLLIKGSALARSALHDSCPYL